MTRREWEMASGAAGQTASMPDGRGESDRSSDGLFGANVAVASARDGLITTDAQLAELLPKLSPIDRVAVDTEADSLHCYFEKLCLVQLSFAGEDFLVDPLAGFDLTPLSAALTGKEIVLQGADFDLRLLRRAMGFNATRIFDTVIAARLLGLREFSLAALVEKYF